jgi:hypothetical protein
MNVLLEAPPSEQSVHVAVRMPMPLQLLSCCFAGHAMHGIEHHLHGTLAGSRAATQTCNGSAVGSDHDLFKAIATGRRMRVDGHERTEMCYSTVRMCVELCL